MSTKVSTDLIDLSGNTGGLVWAKGPTTDQPASATAGEMRVDTTTATTVVYNGTEWRTLKETAFVVPPVPTHFLVIAGGGSGSLQGAGGGGGLRTSYGSISGGGKTPAESTTGISLNTAYTITVGDGGIDTYSSGGSSASGSDSIFSTITSIGGGGAGSTSGGAATATGKDGGSGGGAGSNTGGSPGNGTLNQGYIGGTALFFGGSYAGGGGGGAGGAGGNTTSSTVAGNGGSQLNVAITGASIGYAGGGGGSLYGTGTVGTNDNSAGAAAPSSSSSVNGGSAPFNLGGGGGGANHITGITNIFGGSGGSGVVILRYPTADLPYFTTTGTINTPSATDTVADTAYPVANTAYYKLDSNANDLSGNGYNGTATNITYGNGRFNEASNFNGSSSQIAVAKISQLTDDVSVSLWVNLASTSSGSYLRMLSLNAVQNGWAGTLSVRYQPNSGNFNIGVGNGNSAETAVLNHTYALTQSTWYHICITRNDSTNVTKLYINGSEEDSETVSATATIQSNASSSIGTSVPIYGPTVWNGSIDQVRIFSSALAPGDVEDLYNEHFQTKFTDGSDTALKFTGGTGDITFADTAPVFTPGDNFNTVLYTGNGSTQAITGTGFTPDLIWTKNRSSVQNHYLFDSVRGDFKAIYPDLTNAEFSSTNYISFDSDGFTTGSTQNQNNNNYVAWSWKAGGAARNNTDGSIASLVSANVDAGFSIVSYTGSGSASVTVGHGLNAAPEMYIIKSRGTGDWWVYNENLNGGVNPASYFLRLNLTNAESLNSGSPPSIFAGIEPTASVFSIGASLNVSSTNYIAYCFHSVAAYSKIGSYTGNGSATGPTVVTGFRPAFIMVKNTTTGNNWHRWYIFDNKRDTTNPNTQNLAANVANGEPVSGDANINFLSNGFQISTPNNSLAINESGNTFIFMAFAADPT